MGFQATTFRALLGWCILSHFGGPTLSACHVNMLLRSERVCVYAFGKLLEVAGHITLWTWPGHEVETRDK